MYHYWRVKKWKADDITKTTAKTIDDAKPNDPARLKRNIMQRQPKKTLNSNIVSITILGGIAFFSDNADFFYYFLHRNSFPRRECRQPLCLG